MFDALPLRGQGIWLTRPAEQNERLARALKELGAQVYQQSMLSIEPPPDSKPLLEAMRAVGHGKYFGIALTSRHAVDALMGAAHELNLDARAFHGVKLACVGEKTAEALKQFGLRADIVPPANFNAESLVAEIVRHSLANGRVGYCR